MKKRKVILTSSLAAFIIGQAPITTLAEMEQLNVEDVIITENEIIENFKTDEPVEEINEEPVTNDLNLDHTSNENPAPQEVNNEAITEEKEDRIQSQLPSADQSIISFIDPALQTAMENEIHKNGDNQITKESLAKITKLEKIRDVGITDLSGIEHLVNLKSLELRNNKITDLTPLQSLTALSKLDLRENQIQSLVGIEKLTNLKILDIRSNSVIDLTPIQNLINLTQLDIRDNNVSNISALANLTKLTTLSARGNAIQDLTPIQQATSLVELNLHSNHVKSLEPLRNLTKLEVLILRRNQVQDISPLRNLLALKELNLRDNDIVDLSPLQNHQQLTTRLHLRENSRLVDFSPIEHFYDNIADVDFVLPNRTTIDIEKFAPDVSEERDKYLINTIKKNNTHITDEEIKQSKFFAMASSAFSFYRATAGLFFTDVLNHVIKVPNEWRLPVNLNTWITGDLHTENVGFYGNSLQEAVFDLNDFDEVAVAPFYYDLLKFGTSIYLLNDAAPYLQLNEAEATDAVKSFAKYYEEAIRQIANETIDVNNVYFNARNLDGFVGKLAKDVSKQPLNSELVTWTTLTETGRIFSPTNVRLEEATKDDKNEILSNWDSYVNNLNPVILNEYGKDYFKVKDIVRRVDAGLGSLGYDRYYVLIEGKSSSHDDDVILDIKAQGPSAVEAAFSNTMKPYDSYADRTIDGVFSSIVHPDIHWGTLQGQKSSYLVKERSPFKEEFSHVDFESKEDLDNFLKYSAQVTAFAHSRAATHAGNDDFINNLLQLFNDETNSFADLFAQTSIQYYAQVVSDQRSFTKLFADGLLDSKEEPATDNEEEKPDKEKETNTEQPIEKDSEHTNESGEQGDSKHVITDRTKNPYSNENQMNQTTIDTEKPGESIKKPTKESIHTYPIMHTNQNNQLSEIETGQFKTTKEHKETSNPLPKTATTMFKTLFFGLTVLLVGLGLNMFNRKKNQNTASKTTS